MGRKRKRPFKDGGPTPSSHTGITTSPRFKNPQDPISLEKKKHPVISLYYRHVMSLREYLLQHLPVTSKLRRRRILILDSRADRHPDTHPQRLTLAELLDSTLVGVLKESSPTITLERQREYSSFSSSQSRSILTSTDTGPTCPQSEVVDFVIWKLFNQNNGSYSQPQHLLTHGFQRPAMGRIAQETAIPGIVSQFPNQNAEMLKRGAWTEVLGLLGSNGDEIMMQLLFDCGIFTAINARRGIYYQLSGLPLSVLEPMSDASLGPNRSAIREKEPIATHGQKQGRNTSEQNSDKKLRTPNNIVFLRRRMLYGRAESKSEAPTGLGQKHVLNRFPSVESPAQTVHVMKYIFPLQFRLVNVFTLDSGGRNNIDEWKGNMFRENEISLLEDKMHVRRSKPEPESADTVRDERRIKVPKRLRGTITELVRKLRNRNAQCSYGKLLRYYCPTEQTGPRRPGAFATSTADSKKSEPSSLQSDFVTQVAIKQPSSADNTGKTACDTLKLEPSMAMNVSDRTNSGQLPTIGQAQASLTDYATPASSVSAFCRAVFQKLIPRQFLGVGPEGVWNFGLVLRNIDRFIKLRRFESLTLHQVCEGIKITSIPWLEPPEFQTSRSETTSKIALSDLQKRTELLHEFIFWVFDAIIIPLVRSHFYVTESQTHRNRLFYFRHDTWQQLTQQPFGHLKATMFEELEPERAERVLARRSLGFGALRLLPKSAGIRPILNLRKRTLKEAWGKGRMFPAPSINSRITPVYSMLTYEREQAPSKLGSSMLSVGDMHRRLKMYKEKLSKSPSNSQLGEFKLPPMHFVKLDIKACFDTIPQKKLLSLITELVSEESYRFSKHIEFQPPASALQQVRPTRRYKSRAAPAMKPQHLLDFINSEGSLKKANTIFVNDRAPKELDTEHLLTLLDEHVRHNLVKIGKKYFRQRNGIPQGSVLSSILCNFFYAELEREVLGFINTESSLLMRLVDDFLLITPNADVAMHFLEVMLRGQPSYGVQVNPAKSMANFSATVDGILLPRLEGSPLFPYCGSLIDTHTLEIHRDKDRILEGGESAAATLSDTLTVEASRVPGRTFHRKVLSSFRLQLHPMYIDDGHNSRAVVLSNLYSSFVTSAMKMYHYMKSLRGRAHPGPAIIKQTIHDLILQTAGTIQARRANKSESSLSCFAQRSHLQYLASAAFRFVLKRKQTRYAAVLRWLDSLAKSARPTSDSEALRMTQVVKKGNAMFEEWRF